jgi:hypothetical protein
LITTPREPRNLEARAAMLKALHDTEAGWRTAIKQISERGNPMMD